MAVLALVVYVVVVAFFGWVGGDLGEGEEGGVLGSGGGGVCCDGNIFPYLFWWPARPVLAVVVLAVVAQVRTWIMQDLAEYNRIGLATNKGLGKAGQSAQYQDPNVQGGHAGNIDCHVYQLSKRGGAKSGARQFVVTCTDWQSFHSVWSVLCRWWCWNPVLNYGRGQWSLVGLRNYALAQDLPARR